MLKLEVPGKDEVSRKTLPEKEDRVFCRVKMSVACIDVMDRMPYKYVSQFGLVKFW